MILLMKFCFSLDSYFDFTTHLYYPAQRSPCFRFVIVADNKNNYAVDRVESIVHAGYIYYVA